MITSTLSAIAASGLVTKVCAGLFAGSAVLTAAKNNGAKHKVERQGYIVNPDRRSITERTISFIKDYFFLLVPGYNIYKSFKTFLRNDEVYADERKNLFETRERLVEIKKKEEKPKKVVNKVKEEELEEKLEEELEEEPVKRVPRKFKPVATPKKSEPVKSEPVATTSPFAGLTLEQLIDLKEHYVRIDRNLRNKYTRKQSEGAPVAELNKIAVDTIQNKELYDMVVSRIEVLKVAELFKTPSGSSRVMRK